MNEGEDLNGQGPPIVCSHARSCHGPSTPRPGAQKLCAGKSRAAPVGMTINGAGQLSQIVQVVAN